MRQDLHPFGSHLMLHVTSLDHIGWRFCACETHYQGTTLRGLHSGAARPPSKRPAVREGADVRDDLHTFESQRMLEGTSLEHLGWRDCASETHSQEST